MNGEVIELKGCVDVASDIQKRVRKVGVRGLDIEQAKRVGLFDRISNLLCATHASISAAYLIYSEVDYLLSELGFRKHEIQRAMNDYEKAFDKFYNFWTSYYIDASNSRNDVMEETDALFHHIMRWAQLPEKWELNDKQRNENDVDLVIKVKREGKNDLNFHSATVFRENVGEPKESWCVTKYNEETKKQETVNVDMDKASSIMVAKRLSAEDDEHIYTSSMVLEKTEKRIDVTPIKAFKANKSIGNIKKTFK